jgi:hypothetical protein
VVSSVRRDGQEPASAHTRSDTRDSVGEASCSRVQTMLTVLTQKPADIRRNSTTFG